MARISDYDTIAGTRESEMTLKGSRFIGILMPCPREDCIQENIAMVSERYRDATHYCYAAVFNGSERRERSSDNGEPSGTAGKPILFALKGAGISDAMVVVVRYFGGTLLAPAVLCTPTGRPRSSSWTGWRRWREGPALYTGSRWSTVTTASSNPR